MAILEKILIANRGEIALRILRTCKHLGIKTVAIYSTADQNLKHVKLADEAVCIGPADPKSSYLNIPAIISAAEITHATAIHPGYGFLSENHEFASQVEQSGFTFIGPRPHSIKQMGDKIAAIKLMQEYNIPCIPGSGNPLTDNEQHNHAIANSIGYPIIIKAAGGGGGRGMRVVHTPDSLINAIKLTKQESKQAFANDTIYMEKFLSNPRHIEFQVLGDGNGNAIHLGERDCSIQRKHQKVLEEATAPGISDSIRKQMGDIVVNACKKMQYRGVGTFEFLFENNAFYFIEMNTRIQVEHPVTEMVTGVDLISEQIKLASGQPMTLTQDDISFTGHAIECRINAEDAKTYMPCPGTVSMYHSPGGPGVRMDSHLYSGYTIPANYDSMIAKVIVHGETRKLAIQKAIQALDELVIEGVKTNLELHRQILTDQAFQKGDYNIHYLTKKLEH